MKALRNAKWSCNGTKYVLEAGKDVKVKKEDEKHAIASGLFEIAKPKTPSKKHQRLSNGTNTYKRRDS